MDKKQIGCLGGNFHAGRPMAFRPEAIVIHIAVGSLASVDAQFNDPAAHVSAHYAVGKTGEVHQYVQETDTAFHAGTVVNPTWPLLKAKVNPNFYTIGIEHEGLPDDIWPDSQIDTSAALVSEIAGRWNIPLDPLHVIRHHQIRASKTCPGNFITIEEILRRVPPAAQENSGKAWIVTTVSNVNLRLGSPSVAAGIVRLIPAKTKVTVTGFTKGDEINSNPIWYSIEGGNFLWAGGTDFPVPGKQ
jgi:N-acetylmuramoyl-L-alanine amidase CwlA